MMHIFPEYQGDRILRLPEVKSRTGLSRSSIYLAMKAQTFPASIKLGVRSVGWSLRAIEAWLSSRIDARR